MDHFGKNCYVDFTNPDFVKYAESMHAKGYRVEKAEDLMPILEDAFQAEGSVLSSTARWITVKIRNCPSICRKNLNNIQDGMQSNFYLIKLG